jgi:hypothetical protein
MVRRLKSDLRYFGEQFPERVVEPVGLTGLPEDTPELVLARLLSGYAESVRTRAAALPAREASQSRLALVGLQQRLLSSVAAFARTLEVHLRGLDRAEARAATTAAEAFVLGGEDIEDEPTDEAAAEALIDTDEEKAAEAAAILAAPVSDRVRVKEMLELAKTHAHRPDVRVRWLATWIRENMVLNGQWNERRLVLFTEYEDTRRWLEKRLLEALDDLAPDDRIASFTGATPTDRRENLKRRFNSDPSQEPLARAATTARSAASHASAGAPVTGKIASTQSSGSPRLPIIRLQIAHVRKDLDTAFATSAGPSAQLPIHCNLSIQDF